jgi:Glycine zipper 2TM domain
VAKNVTAAAMSQGSHIFAGGNALRAGQLLFKNCDEPLILVIRRSEWMAHLPDIGSKDMKGPMMRNLVTLFTMATVVAPLALVSPAAAQYDRNHGNGGSRFGYQGFDSRYDQGPREWRGDDGRYYCRRSDGTVGMIIGGAGGALLGRAIDTDGSRATGTILGLAAGALLGREIAKKRQCR